MVDSILRQSFETVEQLLMVSRSSLVDDSVR